jgi:hypothetical protein
MDSVALIVLLIVVIVLLIANSGVGIWCAVLNSKYLDLSSKILLAEKENRDWMSGFMLEQSTLDKRSATQENVLRMIYQLMRDASDSELPQEELARRMNDRLKRLGAYFNETENVRPTAKPANVKGQSNDR